MLSALLAVTALPLAPTAAADPVEQALCFDLDPEPCAAYHCENGWTDGAGVVGDTKYFIGEEIAIACKVAMAQPTVVGFLVLYSCNATVQFLTGGHCDGGYPGTYQGGPMTCTPPDGDGRGLVGSAVDYVELEAYIICLAASMEGGVGQRAVVDSCNNAGQYLFGRDMCFVI